MLIFRTESSVLTETENYVSTPVPPKNVVPFSFSSPHRKNPFSFPICKIPFSFPFVYVFSLEKRKVSAPFSSLTITHICFHVSQTYEQHILKKKKKHMNNMDGRTVVACTPSPFSCLRAKPLNSCRLFCSTRRSYKSQFFLFLIHAPTLPR